MAHFAEINPADNTVIRVLPMHNYWTDPARGASEESAASRLKEIYGGNWKQTSYNTRGGVHQLGGTPLRANYCGKGWVYHPLPVDVFSPPQPFPSWTLDEVKGQWISPVPMPDDAGPEKRYQWNEDDQQWDEVDMT